MIDGQHVLAVVPARGGSKGIPLKNLRLINGTPLVSLVAPVVAAVTEIDRTVVSTDHDGIAEAAEAAGIPAPFRRPAELSGDRIGNMEVLVHALTTMELRDDVTYDIVVLLQPTSPLRQPEHIAGALRMLLNGNWEAVWTVSETDSKHHPLKQLTLKESGALQFYDPQGDQVTARQALTPTYHRNGVAFAIRRESLLERRTIAAGRTGAFVIDGPQVNIDTEWEIELAEYLLSRSRSNRNALD